MTLFYLYGDAKSVFRGRPIYAKLKKETRDFLRDKMTIRDYQTNYHSVDKLANGSTWSAAKLEGLEKYIDINNLDFFDENKKRILDYKYYLKFLQVEDPELTSIINSHGLSYDTFYEIKSYSIGHDHSSFSIDEINDEELGSLTFQKFDSEFNEVDLHTMFFRRWYEPIFED